MSQLIRFLRFLGMIIRRGTLQPAGENFNVIRSNELEKFKGFIPTNKVVTTKSKKPSFFNNLIGQLAYIKNSFFIKGGHLCAASSNLCYIRIPKSASTSMNHAMLECMYNGLREKSITDEQVNFLADANLETTAPRQISFTFFTLVRNPFERLVSVYRAYFENKKNSFLYSDYLFGILKRDISFEEFINSIELIPDSLKDQHIKPQSHFLHYYKQKNINVSVLKLEEPKTVESFLSNFSIQLPHQNKNQQAYRYEDYYTAPLLKKVHSIYQEDIVRFGYQSTFTSLLQHVKSLPKKA